jgi:alkylhydroperoxidase/carboxymuconolactone decarboxylase family protein YurZ
MSISEIALKNHEKLFPNRKSKLAETDPELIDVFNNFAFDEVLQHGNLDARTRLMVILASMIACQAIAEYKMTLGGALNVGITPVEVKESVYQAVPYLGIAKVYEFFHAKMKSCYPSPRSTKIVLPRSFSAGWYNKALSPWPNQPTKKECWKLSASLILN